MPVGVGISFASLLYRPIFDRLAVTAKLTLADGTVFTQLPNGSPLVALDKTVGVALPMQGGTVIETVTPMAEFMIADVLALGLTANSLDKGTIELNGKSWLILSHKMNPSASGETDGTVYLQLEGEADD